MLNSLPHDFPVWSLLAELSRLRSIRYEMWTNITDLERAIVLGRGAVSLCPQDYEDRYMILNNLASSLSLRNEHCGRYDNLDEIINLGHAVLAYFSKKYPHVPAARNLSCSEQSGGRVNRGESMTLNRAIQKEEAVHWPMALNNLGVALRMRFERGGNANDLDESIELHRNALTFHTEGHPDRPKSLNNLAISLRIRFEQRGREEDLDESIRLHRVALTLRPIGHPDRSSSLCNLGGSLSTRFQHCGVPADLDEAIQLFRDSLFLCSEDDIDHGTCLNNLVNALGCRYEQSRSAGDLEESIRLYGAARNLYSDGHPERYTLGNLGITLCTRFRRNGSMDDLNDSIQLLRDSLDLIPERVDLSFTFNGLGVALQTRFEQSGREEDLNEAIKFHRDALALRPEGHAKYAMSLDNLAVALCLHFEHRGVVEDLNESITLHRKALRLRPVGHPDRHSSLHNLANALSFRFNEDKRSEDLDESISLLRDALDLLPIGSPYRSLTLNNLAIALKCRFRQLSKANDLDASIQLFQGVLTLRPQGHPDRSISLSNLGCAFLDRFDQYGNEEDINDSLSLLHDALALCPVGHPDRSSSLCNIGNALVARFRKYETITDLDESITLHRDALVVLPEGHPNYADTLCNLAIALEVRFGKVGMLQDCEDCIQALNTAASHKFSSSAARLKAAYLWASVARRQDHDTTLMAYRTAVTLLERSLNVRPSLSTRHDLLASNDQYQTLAVDAASFAIGKGNLASAIEVLEQGRTLLWSQLRGFRSSLDRLSETNGTLANRFAVCSRDLEALITSPGSQVRMTGPAQSLSAVDESLQRARRLANELDSIIEEIRHVSGFEDFLRAAPFGKLQQAALEGPVIVINHSKFRCDAVIVLPRADIPCVCVPLDADWYDDAFSLCDDLLQSRHKDFVHSVRYDETLRRVMKTLWDRVVSKVVEKLKELGIPNGSRIWWCPTRYLTALPFHAAGPYADEGGNMKYLLDDYISSYTPTLQSLIVARTDVQVGTEKLLFMGDTELPSARKERDAIRKHLRIAKCLLDERASGDSVMKALSKARWVHFACHGSLDMEKPFDSSFALPGGKLTLLDIARANLPNAELAFLSACHTAEQSPNFAMDEVLHLAAGMQFCGFRSVIGTMWQLLDRDGPLLAEAVYMHLINDVGVGEPKFKEAAAAVQKASLYMKSQKGWTDDGRAVDIATERWVNLVHIGA